MPLNTTSSIVDLLRSRNLPTDLGFRSQLYQSLGLGTADQFMSGARTTGATNVQLLQRLSQNPSLIDTISGAVRAGTGLQGLRLPQAGGSANPAPGQGQGQNVQPSPAQGLTLPSTVEGINAMQSGQAPSRNLTIAEHLMGRYEGSQQSIQQILTQLGGMNRTADDVFREVSDVRTKLGIPALEEEYAKLNQDVSAAERDVRSEVATSGGIVTDSQARSLALERQSKILPQLERISTDLATKSTLASQIQSQLQVSRQEATQRATALLSFYQGDAQQAFSAAMDFYKLDADEAKATLAAEKEDKKALLELSLKYPTAGIDLSEDGLDGAYAKAARVAADYEDLNRISAELDLKLKAKELAKPYGGGGGSISSSFQTIGGTLTQLRTDSQGNIISATALGPAGGQSAESQKLQQNVQSGLRALDILQDEIGTDTIFGKNRKLLQAAVPGSPGARTLTTARREVLDVISRLRTGAALTASEEKFYRSQLPSVLDSKATIRYKLETFRNFFSSLSSKDQFTGQTALLSDPLGLGLTN